MEHASAPAVRHHVALCRFEAEVEGALAYAQYEHRGQGVALTHTFVPDPLRGRGLAAALVQATLDWARSEGLEVDPVCSYAAAYVARQGRSRSGASAGASGPIA